MEEISQFLGEDFYTMLVRILLAAFLCGLIGFERELKNHSAGFRTHILVGVGACMMMLLSIYGFEAYATKYDTIRFDPARIPSYVISGIGFLGAGTIMVHGSTIRGLTTAASIWTVAGLGLVIGAGMYSLALLATLVVLLSLIVLNSWEKVFTSKNRANLNFVFHLGEGAHVGDVLNIFEDFSLVVKKVEIKKDGDERNIMIELEKYQQIDRNEILEHVSKIENVTYVYKK